MVVEAIPFFGHQIVVKLEIVCSLPAFPFNLLEGAVISGKTVVKGFQADLVVCASDRAGVVETIV